MPVVIEKKMQKSISEVSRKMGIREKEVIDRALLLFLENAKKILDVEKEFRVWDILSDEAWMRFAKRLPSKRL